MADISILKPFENEWYFDMAKRCALGMLANAQVGISGKRVGAGLVAQNKYGASGVFGGCNQEYATSYVLHAEEVAIAKAVAAGYTTPKIIFITSTNGDQQAAMCGRCMQIYMYGRRKDTDVVIVVLEPDGEKIKLVTTLLERNGPYAYLGGGRIDHDQ